MCRCAILLISRVYLQSGLKSGLLTLLSGINHALQDVSEQREKPGLFCRLVACGVLHDTMYSCQKNEPQKHACMQANALSCTAGLSLSHTYQQLKTCRHSVAVHSNGICDATAIIHISHLDHHFISMRRTSPAAQNVTQHKGCLRGEQVHQTVGDIPATP